MQIDNELLAKLEKLSLLKISEDKREEVKEQLSQLLNYVDNLSELDTSGADGVFAMSDNSTYTREDEPNCIKDINESILANAPQSSDNFFIVPKIIE
ncbi:MAG: Asp-tRNA(Asn)/Glu-tRNA(Gln) amidotransferase subunit GatC [Sulfurimonas sp.]|jgi:aspartyl-tRNA(Asn)/glutamyl-tRNA(Gln) amidotransferase subunit C|nr:Asp-tRNA(Asn)/Glu-tRNA(Gln) amidotransferase subunit GatC [Sulfurimonadaceae bacterium]